MVSVSIFQIILLLYIIIDLELCICLNNNLLGGLILNQKLQHFGHLMRLVGKDPDAGKDWEHEKRVTEDEMVGWHHWLNEHEFEQTLKDSEGWGRLACYSPWVADSRTWLGNWATTNDNWCLKVKQHRKFLHSCWTAKQG